MLQILMICHDLSFNYECTLRCAVIATTAKLWKASHQLKVQLSASKKQVLADKIAQLAHLNSASEIMNTMRPFLGSSNALKQGPRPLPLVLDEGGHPCESASAAIERWINFFMCMEGGQRISASEQRQLWLANLAAYTVDTLEVDVCDVPLFG